MKKIVTELLSPAGSYESFEGSIGAGADAVYVGGPAFGARAYARNFTQEELIAAIETAHLHNRKLYLTVNTLLKNREMEGQLFEYLAPYYEAGLDAVIVQDLGVFSFIRRNFPDLDIHASTQMTVTGPEGMKFLEEKGATRVASCKRELSLAEISASESSLLQEATRVAPFSSRNFIPSGPVTVICVLAWISRSGKFLRIKENTPRSCTITASSPAS